jgi:hypothetical protein
MMRIQSELIISLFSFTFFFFFCEMDVEIETWKRWTINKVL